MVEGKSDLITLAAKNARVTVRNVKGVGENPDRYKRTAGRFFKSNSGNKPDYILIEHCHLIKTSGIFIRDMDGGTVKVRYNLADHIDGRFSDGNGGYINESIGARDTRQFVMLRKCNNLVDSEIAWNRVINVSIPGDFYQNYAAGNGKALTQQEDLFNFNAGGRKGDSLRVHHNIGVGAYKFDPAAISKYSGGGYIADGGDCKYLLFDHNYAIGLQNYSYSVATPGAIVFRENVGVGSGILPDGEISGYNSIALSHQLTQSPNSRFVRNRAAYVNTRPSKTRYRKDWNFKNCKNGNCDGNISLRKGELIGRDFELEIIREWDQLAANNGVTVGLYYD